MDGFKSGLHHQQVLVAISIARNKSTAILSLNVLLGFAFLLIDLLRGPTTMPTVGTALAGNLAPATDFVTIQVEDDGDGDHGGSEAAEQGASPLDTEVIEHLVCEEREAGAEE